VVVSPSSWPLVQAHETGSKTLGRGSVGRMSDAFILGAGFSKAISPFMPLTFDLGTRSVDQIKSLHASRVPQDGHGYRCDDISCDGGTAIGAFQSKALDFEEWLTSLSEPQPYLLPPDNARRAALFAELTGSISWVIEQSVGGVVSGHTPPSWLAELVAGWHERRASVVTFNYDTLVEATVDYLKPVAVGYPDGMIHQLLGPSVIPYWTMFYRGGSRLHAGATFRYFKLHGSTNWYWDETTRAADSIVQIGLRHEWDKSEPSLDDDEVRHRAAGKVPMIVPPTTGKSSYFTNQVIRFLWQSAYEGLRAAERVFIFGYSLPPGDTLVRGMLADALPGKEVWVIDPSTEVRDRFESLRPGSVRNDFAATMCDVEKFVAAYLGS
jgi:hypothetical protein